MKKITALSILVFLLLSPGLIHAQTLAADANGDNKVDGLDYVVWINNYNRIVSEGKSAGDYNSDNKVDGLDYVVWLNTFGDEIAPPNDVYPKTLPSSNDVVTFIETKAPEGNKIFIEARSNLPSIYRVNFYINNVLQNTDNTAPYFLGGDTAGNPNGLVLSSSPAQIKVSVGQDINGTQTFTNAQFDYQFTSSGSQPTATPTATATPVSTATPTATSAPTSAPTVPPTTGQQLRWAPPALTNPTTINVTSSTGNLNLDTTKDYIINMPTTAYPKVMYIIGGRNIHLIGGVISVNSDTSSTENAGLRIYDSTGTVHIEGLRLTGPYLSDGIHTKAPLATVQLQNIYIDPMWQKGDPDGSGSHGDCIQTWGGVKELRVDKYSCSNSPYQGFYLQANYGQPHGNVTMSRVDVTGGSSARYLFWISTSTFNSTKTVTLDNVWANSTNRNIDRVVCYWLNSNCTSLMQLGTDSGVEYANWPTSTSPRVIGRVNEGLPSTGRFVNPASVGLNYQSPGYQ